MSSEKILLPDFLIADLYKDCLVDLSMRSYMQEQLPKENSAGKIEQITPSTQNIKYLGQNGKNVIIIVDQKKADYLLEEELDFLTNILKACQLNQADIAIINIAAQLVTYTSIKEHLGGLNVLLFDVEPSSIKIPFKIPLFQIQKFDESTILLAPALSELNKKTQDGRILKTKLWVSLKQMFGMN